MPSYTFFPSIPKREDVGLLVHIFKSRKEGTDAIPKHRIVVEAVVKILNDDADFSRQDVYGLTAVGLQYYDLLKSAQSQVATLRETKPDGSVVTVSNNHRYFVMPDGVVVDPLHEQLQRGNRQVTWTGKARINSYPVSVAQGMLTQFAAMKAQQALGKRNDSQVWFDQAVQRLSARFNMSAATFNEQDAKAHRQRKEFEGILRACVGRFKSASEQWKHYLLQALENRFPPAPAGVLVGLVSRLEDEHGPELPRNKVPLQRKKIKMIEPSMERSS